MKKIVFEGQEYEVEDWVNYAARDGDGTVCCFENKPKYNNEYSDWHCNGGKYQEPRVLVKRSVSSLVKV